MLGICAHFNKFLPIQQPFELGLKNVSKHGFTSPSTLCHFCKMNGVEAKPT